MEKRTHLIADSSLGGLLREYMETDRKASVGDYVIYKNEGRIAKTIDNRKDFRGDGETYLSTAHDYRATPLSPTEIIHVDGERFRMVDRKAEVGEKVVSLIDANDRGVNFARKGEVTEVIKLKARVVVNSRSFELFPDEYRVLEPIEAEPEAEVLTEVTTAEASPSVIATVDETEASPSVLDMLANLSQRIVALEAENKRQNDDLDTLHRNNVKLAEELANSKAPVTTEVDAVDFSGFVDAVAAKVADRIAKGLSR